MFDIQILVSIIQLKYPRRRCGGPIWNVSLIGWQTFHDISDDAKSTREKDVVQPETSTPEKTKEWMLHRIWKGGACLHHAVYQIKKSLFIKVRWDDYGWMERERVWLDEVCEVHCVKVGGWRVQDLDPAWAPPSLLGVTQSWYIWSRAFCGMMRSASCLCGLFTLHS